MDLAEQRDLGVFPNLPPLTARQEKLFRYIWEYWQQHTYTPTQREMAAHMEMSSSNPAPHLNALESKGYVRRVPGSRRNIRITHAGAKKLELLGVLTEEQLDLFERE